MEVRKEDQRDQDEKVVEIEIERLRDFKNHPFKVQADSQMKELQESIKKYGILNPLIVRPRPEGFYEIISGHRRKYAAQQLKYTKVPVIIRYMLDEDAIISMIDANLQRERISPSEKAFAYKMKLEAMKRQGARTDLTSSKTVTETSDQVGPKLDNPTLVTHGLASNYDSEGKWSVVQKETNTDCNIRSNELLARQVGESVNQIKRYIRLTNLIPKVLDMVDEGKIAFTIAVELSFLTEEQQYELYEVMDEEQCTPSLSQANRMKRMSQSGNLDMDAMFSILEQEKPNQREQIKIRADLVAKYFPEDFTPKQKTDLIEKLLKEWYDKQKHEKKQSPDSSRGKAR